MVISRFVFGRQSCNSNNGCPCWLSVSACWGQLLHRYVDCTQSFGVPPRIRAGDGLPQANRMQWLSALSLSACCPYYPQHVRMCRQRMVIELEQYEPSIIGRLDLTLR
jgi:hypothetical protein